ncbi:MAG TPA: WhiB family transcriptional regulator [Gemmatimonadales bacterium]|nr:WhiB family transcriptional regulator [Gemmatimonadales bacterium]
MIDWERPGWQARSKCGGSRPALFYPEKGEGEDATAVAQAAKSVCNGLDGQPACPVKQECLEFALQHHEKFGVWGGRTERERNSLKRMRKKVNGVGRVVRQVKKSPLRQILDTSKTETRILGAIQRHIMIRPPDDRRQDVIHPSEMCKSDWCPRSTFFRLVGAPAIEDTDANPFTLENVWAEGHDIHDKWQTWLWEMGLLRGHWRCNACKTEWDATAPKSCPLCKADVSCLEYREVPLTGEKYLIGGHADGDIADDDVEELCPLIEIKSIGMGTIRYDAPHLLSKYTRKVKNDDGSERSVFDMEALWRDLKRPFASHVKQGMLYLAISGRREIIFIYENKFNQQVKEFRVRYQETLVADLLDACLDIKYALKSNTPPRRPHWAAIENTTCAKCVYRENCWDAALENDDEEPGSRNGRESSNGQGPARTRRVVIAGSSGLRNTKASA